MRIRLIAALTTLCGTAGAAEITVNSTDDVIADDGVCTLREAIIAANTDTASGDAEGECVAGEDVDDIIVPAGTFNLTIDGDGEDAAATGDLDITTDMGIVGAGEGLTIIDAGNRDRIFETHGVHVVLLDMTLQNGAVEFTDGDTGGCVAIDNGDVVLERVTITSCDAEGNSENLNFGGVGGGLSVNDATVEINESTISSNRARGTEDGGGIGGGVYVASGQVEITDSTIASNQSGSSSRGAGYGAGIRVISGDLTLVRTTISGNRGSSGGNEAPHGDGIAFSGTTLTITDSTISGNGSGHCDDGGHGGGLWLDSGSATITGSTFSGNQNTEGAGIRSEGTLLMLNSTISGNGACAGAGGLQVASGTTTLAFVTITNNDSDDGSGGLDLNANSSVLNSIIAGNADLDCVDAEGASLGGNILGTDCGIAGGDDLATDDLVLGELADNGGDTQTHAFTDEDFDDVASCLDADGDAVASDQRGEIRPANVCTSGAFEIDPVCGDGSVSGVEACDDGNTDDGDGCSSACEIEGAATCIGEPSVCVGDSDGDGSLDAVEALCGTDPADPASVPTDTDGDGLCDALDADADGNGTDDIFDALCEGDLTDADGDGVCDVLQADDAGNALLVLTEEEEAGDNCANGGLRIITGTDADGDGALADDEIASEGYACNGGAGNANGGGLVAVRNEPAGDRCANGGVRIQVGTDLNEDGQLGQGEISSTRFVCNGEDGADGQDGRNGVDGEDGQDGRNGVDGEDGRNGTNGLNGEDGADGVDGRDALIVSQEEPAGDNCPDGGIAILGGLDLDRDGTLDANEVTSRQYICGGAGGGANGRNALTETRLEPAGANCAAGGVRIQNGLDLDGDGNLDANEVRSTRYVCNGVDGADGADGQDGMNGADGRDGVDGAQGPAGQDGADGANGQDGMDGAPGADGQDGMNGADGADGAQGPAGEAGADGVNGADGANGANGSDGMNGADGSDGFSALVATAPLAAGEGGCPGGGLEVSSGIDDGSNGGVAGDGSLQAGEVRQTDVLCSPPAPASDSGCSVATGTSADGQAWWLALLAPLVMVRRRRVR